MRIKEKLHEIIFEADTKEGKLFDVILLVLIFMSVFLVILSSVDSIYINNKLIFQNLEWLFTFLFTIEYILRIYSVKRPFSYIFSFMGIVDFLAIIPTYLVFLFPPIRFLVDIRVVRLIRIFRVFKLSRFLKGARTMEVALKSSRPKIVVFLLSVVILVIILGTLMFIVEGKQNGFENIPKSIYWAIVTLTTVGYGNVVPATVVGKIISSVVMILGYGIIAVPTGIVSVEMSKNFDKISTQSCKSCSKEGHDSNAVHCKFCGDLLN